MDKIRNKEQNEKQNKELWPVMLTPFTTDGKVDYEALKKLTQWYIENGVDGLFAVCQSSEMFYLDDEESIQIAKTVLAAAAGRVPVIASGHIADDFSRQAEEINRMGETGVAAVILITNRLAVAEESDVVWMDNCEKLLQKIRPDIALGLYECPYPYKRLMSVDNLRNCAKTGRFHFLKDTCCDIRMIDQRLAAVSGTPLALYNANTTTLLASLRDGAAGFSGVMANFHPQLYRYLLDHYTQEDAKGLQDCMTMFSLIERQLYPVNAKYYLQTFEHLPITTYCRTADDRNFTETFRTETAALYEATKLVERRYM